MKFYYIYAGGFWSIRDNLGLYACYEFEGNKYRRQWASTERAEKWLNDNPPGSRGLWSNSDCMIQAKPGQPSIAHRTFVPSNGYRPLHGGYPERTAWKTESFAHPYGGTEVPGVAEKMCELNEVLRFASSFADKSPPISSHSGTVTGRFGPSAGNLTEISKLSLWPVFNPQDSNEEATTVPVSLVDELSQQPTSEEARMGRVIAELQSQLDMRTKSRNWWRDEASKPVQGERSMQQTITRLKGQVAALRESCDWHAHRSAENKLRADKLSALLLSTAP